MIPLSIEQSSSRQPNFSVLIAWGGDLALASGLMNPVVATASSSAAGHPATAVNSGDKSLLNNSWWESTNASGKVFSVASTPGGFLQTFQNLAANTQVILQTAGLDSTPITLTNASFVTTQQFIFPKNRSAYIRASVVGTIGDILRIGDTYTGHYTDFTIATTGVSQAVYLDRLCLDGGTGNITITWTNHTSPRTVVVSQFEAYVDSSCMDWVKHALSPYTNTAATFTGNANYVKSNLILEPESFLHAWRFVGGATASTDVTFPVTPEQNGSATYKLTFPNTTSYVYTPVEVAYSGKSFTLSAWVRSDVASSFYIGVFEDSQTAGNSSVYYIVDATTSWTRVVVQIPSQSLRLGTIKEYLNVFFGLPSVSTQVYVWGVQLVEDGLGNYHQYYKLSTDTQLLTNTYQFGSAPWVTDVGTITAGSYIDEDHYDVATFATNTSFTRSFLFDGSTNYITTTNHSDFDVASNNISITFWLKKTSAWANGIVFLCRSNGTSGWYAQTANGGHIQIVNDTGTTYTETVDNLGTKGVWVHWAFVKTAGSPWKIYKNGVECTYVVQTGTNPTTISRTFYIGCYDSTGFKIDATWCDIRWFNKALSGVEVAAITGGDIAISPANLVSWWKCDDTSGTTATDTQGVHNGTINGTTTNFFSTDHPTATYKTNNVYALYNKSVPLTGYSLVVTMWIKATSAAGLLYVIVGLDDDSQYVVKVANVQTTYQQVSVTITFTTTARTIAKIQFGIKGLGAYSTLSDNTIMIRDACVFSNDQSDHIDLLESSTNLFTYSEQLDNAAWTTYNSCVVTANAYNNPITHTLTADKLTGTNCGVYQDESTVAPASNTFTVSFWARSDASTDPLMNYSFSIQLSDKSAQIFTQGATVNCSWKFISYTATFVASAEPSVRFSIDIMGAAPLYIWGLQLEAKNVATPYIATTSAVVTRTANSYSFATPASISGTSSNFEVVWKGSFLADALQVNKHVLFDMWNTGTTEFLVYVQNNNVVAKITDSAGTTTTGTIPLSTLVTLHNDIIVSLARTAPSTWKLYVMSTYDLATTFVVTSVINAPTSIYVGADHTGSYVADARVGEFLVFARDLTVAEESALIILNNPTIYDTDSRISAIAPFLNRSSAYKLAGGNVAFTLNNIAYPYSALFSFIKNIDFMEVVANSYTLANGYTWNYNASDWLLLTFALPITFNRLKLYQYPNMDSSLQSPYTAGKGGLKNWFLEYWDATTSQYIPFYRKQNSLDDLDVIDLTQLCTNGTFEESTAGWLPTNSYVTLNLVVYNVYAGIHSMSVSSISWPNPDPNPASLMGAKTLFVAQPGMTYEISCMVYNYQISSINTILQITDAISTTSTTISLPQCIWTRMNLSYTAPADLQNTTVELAILTDKASGGMGIDDVQIIPSISTITTTKIRISIQDTQVANDTAKIVAMQVFNYTDESIYVKDNEVRVMLKKTANTNQIAPSYFQIKLSNTSRRYSPKNTTSPIYGYTQPDGRGFLRAGSLVEIYGTLISGSDTYKQLVMSGIIGNDQNAASSTGIELATTDEEVLLVGGDSMIALSNKTITDSNTLQNQPLEKIIQFICQQAGFAVQDMQLDTTGQVIPYRYIGNGTNVLEEINTILEATHGNFFVDSSAKRLLCYYDGIKFKSWLQTTQTDFDAGTKTDVTTSVSPGNVQLNLHNTPLLMSSGNWTNTNTTDGDFPGMVLIQKRYFDYTDGYCYADSVRNYNMNGMNHFILTPKASQTISNYVNDTAELGLVHYQGSPMPKFGLRTSEGTPALPQSVLRFGNNYLDKVKPIIGYALLDEQNNVLKSGDLRLLNSGEDGAYISSGSYYTLGNMTNLTLNILRRRVYVIDGVEYYGALTWCYQDRHVQGAHSAVEDPSTHIWYTGYRLEIESMIYSAISYPVAEDDAWVYDEIFATDSTIANYPGTTTPCAYYYQGRVSKHQTFTMRDYTTATMRVFAGIAGKCYNDDYLNYGWQSGWNNTIIDYSDILANNIGKKVRLKLYVPAASVNQYGGFQSAGQDGTLLTTYSFMLSDPEQCRHQIWIQYMYFAVWDIGVYNNQPGKLFIDAIRHGVRTFKVTEPSSNAISSTNDTGITTPIWGNLTWTLKNFLDLSRGEGYSIYSQASSDGLSWYGQGGLNQWDLDYNSTSDPVQHTYYDPPVNYTARILSPTLRYIRFKIVFRSTDFWSSPIFTGGSFTYTANGNIISQVLDGTVDLTAWQGFSASQSIPTSTQISYSTLTADDAAFTSPDSAGWLPIVPGGLITSANKRYLKWKAVLSTTNGNFTPTLSSVGINWTNKLNVTADFRYYAYDDRIISFDPRSGYPSCNQCSVSANASSIDLTTNSITAQWNGAGSATAKTCGQDAGSYQFATVALPLTVTATTPASISVTLSNPTLTPNCTGYTSYPRACYVTIGGVNYGIFGYDSGIKEGVTQSWASIGGGTLTLTMSGGGQVITLAITESGAGSVDITAIKFYGYSIKAFGDFDPPQLATMTSNDIQSQQLYNHIFSTIISNPYIYSPTQAVTVANLIVENGKWIKDYGPLTIPLEFSVTLQSRVNIDSPNSEWSKQWADVYEVLHNWANMTTTLTIKET